MKNNNNFQGTFAGVILLLTSSCTGTPKQEYTAIELFSAGLEDVVEYRVPSLMCTPAGTLIALVDARKDQKGDIPNNVDLAIRRSED